MRIFQALTVALLVVPAVADETVQGIAETRPVEGVSVAVGDRFMVPYSDRIPGTDISFEMIPVPGGTFLMGSPADAPDHKADEGPQVRVVVDPRM